LRTKAGFLIGKGERGKKAMHEINVLKIVLSLPLAAYQETLDSV